MPRDPLDRGMELRKVGDGTLFQVITALDMCGDWKSVMAHAPLDPRKIDGEDYETKFTLDHVRTIENHATRTGRKPTAIFFDEWGTSGKVHPTLETLQKLVGKLQLYRAMVEMAQLLGDPVPERPKEGPAAPVDTDVSNILREESLENGLNDIKTVNDSQLTNQATYNNNIDRPQNNHNAKSREFPDFLQHATLLSTKEAVPSNMIQFTRDHLLEVVSDELPLMLNQHSVQPSPAVPLLQVQQESSETEQVTDDSSDMPVVVSSMNRSTEEHKLTGINYSYAYLKSITRSFDAKSNAALKIGGRIGKGGFGEVYVGFDSDQHIAVKRLLDSKLDEKTLLKQFRAEVGMTYYRHVNIVQVLGYSIDGPENLIVSEFISGGNLRQKLNQRVLNTNQRFGIILGTAKGLQYLHYGTEKNLIHKDVTSPNILLTENCIPKLCDFGLTRMQDTDTTKLMGTGVYVAPEVYRHDITPKMDVFSYGMVLLEILTGHQPVVQFSNNVSKNIQTFVQEELIKKGNERDITPLLESNISQWTIANHLYYLAGRCLAEFKQRPDSRNVCTYLESLNTGGAH